MQLKLKITGQVQGVCYRDSVRKEAVKINLVGYARNKSDGSVEVIAAGEKDKLIRLEKFCKNNPGYSKVDKVTSSWSSSEKIFSTFKML